MKKQSESYNKHKTFVISCLKRRKEDGVKIWVIFETPLNKLECLAMMFLYDAYDYTVGSYGEFRELNNE